MALPPIGITWDNYTYVKGELEKGTYDDDTFEQDYIISKYATKEERAKLSRLKNGLEGAGTQKLDNGFVMSDSNTNIQNAKEYGNSLYEKYYDKAKRDYLKGMDKMKKDQQKAEAEKAKKAKEKAKPKSEYKAWKLDQPINKVRGWLKSVADFIERNKDILVGIGGVIAMAGTAIATAKSVINQVKSLTNTLKSALSSIKDLIKHKKEPTPEEQEEIDKNTKSVSMRMYSFIRDCEHFTPFVKQDKYSLKLGFGFIVDNYPEYRVTYPSRDDSTLANEYMSHVKDETINEWIKTVKPDVAPLDLIYDLYNRDIQNIEKLINQEITDVKLDQYEFDALASFLWVMRDEGLIYDQLQPNRVIKEIHSLLYYQEDRNVVGAYMNEVDSGLIQDAKIYNRRQAEITLFLTGNYECLQTELVDKNSYEEAFSEMKNEYLAKKTKNEELKKFSSFVGNDTLNQSIEATNKRTIKLYDSDAGSIPGTGNGNGNVPMISGGGTIAGSGSYGYNGINDTDPNTPVVIGSESYNQKNKVKVSPNELLGSEIVNGMIYPVLGKLAGYRGGKDNTGINNDGTICYGWFGSERGEGQGIHYGVDLVCDKNNPIVLPYDGTIIKIGVPSFKEDINEKLRRVVFKPDANQDIVISLYYLNKDAIYVSENTHYTAGTLVGYIGDCSPLFNYIRKKDSVSPYDYLHLQINQNNEKGLPINPTMCIMKAVDAETIINIPTIERTSGSSDIQITHPGVYEITLVSSGGLSTTGNLSAPAQIPVTEAQPANMRYSLTGTRGCYMIVRKYLEVGTYHYEIKTNPNTSTVERCTFGTYINNIYAPDLICNNGKNARFTSDVLDTNIGSTYEIVQEVVDEYTIIEAAKGNTGRCISNICGYEIQEGALIPFTIKAGEGDVGAYETYGKGGEVGLNGASASGPTAGFLRIKYYSYK